MREPEIDVAVAIPVLRAILEVLDEHVAQRPERAVREPVVVPVHVGLVEPHAAQRVRLLAGRNGEPPHLVGDFPVRRAGTPSDPRAVDPPHRGIERADQTAGGLFYFRRAVDALHVLVGLTVRNKNELAVAEIVREIEH